MNPLSPTARPPVDLAAPRISVLIAAWNAEPTLEAATRSALEQTLPVHEVLVCDDASTDGTAELARRLGREDSRVRHLRASVNAGPGSARNMGIDAATGTHVAVLDADDLWLPQRMERIVAQMKAHAADLVGDNLLFVDPGINQIVRTAWALEPEGPPIELTLRRFLRHTVETIFGWHNIKPVVALDFLRRHEVRYYEGQRSGEDYGFVAEALLAGARAILIPEALYLYTLPRGLVSGAANPHQRTPSQPRDTSAAVRFYRRHAASLEPQDRGLVRRRIRFIEGERLLRRSRSARRAGRWLEGGRLLLHPHALEAWIAMRRRRRLSRARR